MKAATLKTAADVVNLVGVSIQTALAVMAAAQEGQRLMVQLQAEQRDPTPEEIANLEALNASLRARLNVPLPQELAGDSGLTGNG